MLHAHHMSRFVKSDAFFQGLFVHGFPIRSHCISILIYCPIANCFKENITDVGLWRGDAASNSLFVRVKVPISRSLVSSYHVDDPELKYRRNILDFILYSHCVRTKRRKLHIVDEKPIVSRVACGRNILNQLGFLWVQA